VIDVIEISEAVITHTFEWKHIDREGRSNRNKYTVINDVTKVIACLFIICWQFGDVTIFLTIKYVDTFRVAAGCCGPTLCLSPSILIDFKFNIILM
jgi:hypothetical protein